MEGALHAEAARETIPPCGSMSPCCWFFGASGPVGVRFQAAMEKLCRCTRITTAEAAS